MCLKRRWTGPGFRGAEERDEGAEKKKKGETAGEEQEEEEEGEAVAG